jgi:undecaprenyl pyrophosphate phosphatase UppP
MAAGILQMPDALNKFSGEGTGILVAGFLSSTIAGFAAISWLIKYLNFNGLKIFIVYRILLAAFLVIIQII